MAMAKTQRKRAQAREALQAAFDAEFSDAEDYIDSIETERARATGFYNLRADELDADVGRSSAKTSDVYDTVNFLLPSLMRVFFSTDRPVEYRPAGPEDVELAKQATDYIGDVVVQQDNAGFLIFWNAFKDALLRKTGVFKWWWDESVSVETVTYTGLDEIQHQVLVDDPDVEIVEETAIQSTTDGPDPAPVVTASYDVTARHYRRKGRARFAAVPPEELVIARRARSIDDSSIVAHRCVKTVGELIAMGYAAEEVLPYAGSAEDYSDTDSESEAKRARNPDYDAGKPNRTDESARKVLYVEAFMRYDLDEDGIGELIKVVGLGTDHEIVDAEPVAEIPIADICPDPEPHTAIGSCPGDAVTEIQLAKTQILRDVMDSLGESIIPRRGVVEGQVNMDDVLNVELGAPIRMRAPGMIQDFTVPFVGKEALPMLQYLDEVREARTGASKASMGLDAGALQSSTRAAVAATIQAAQGRVELIARIFAETGIKRLFKGLLRLVTENQDQERVVRLRNQWVRVDPRVWDAGMDVSVNVGLSASSTEERMAALSAIAEKQEQILMQLGPANPLADLAKYRETLARMVTLAGFKDPSSFFGEITPATLQQMQQAAGQQPPNPETILAQAEVEKAKAQAAKIQSDAQLDRAKLLMEDDRERDRMEADVMLRAAEIQAKYHTSVDVEMIRQAMARPRNQGAGGVQ